MIEYQIINLIPKLVTITPNIDVFSNIISGKGPGNIATQYGDTPATNIDAKLHAEYTKT